MTVMTASAVEQVETLEQFCDEFDVARDEKITLLEEVEEELSAAVGTKPLEHCSDADLNRHLENTITDPIQELLARREESYVLVNNRISRTIAHIPNTEAPGQTPKSNPAE